MNFKFPCPHCGQRVEAEDELLGQNVACPTCSQNFVVRPPEEQPAVVMTSSGSGALPAADRSRSHYWAMAIFATVLALTISGGIFLGGKMKSAPTPPRDVAGEQEKLTPSVPEIADPRSSLIPGLPGSPETQASPSNIIPGLSDVPGLPAPASSPGKVAPTGGAAGAAIIFPKPESTDATLQAKLNKILFPRIDFRDATLSECVDFLNYKSKELDPQRVGISVVIASSIPPSTTGLRLTLRLDNVPQMEILNYVAYLCGLKFRIDASGVTLLPKDDTKTFERLQKAAAQGNPEAQYNLGMVYANGQGVRKDHTKAFEWFQKAAAQGYPEAQRNLGMMYGTGQGVPQDDKKAFEWFQKAAAQGNAMAQNDLGVMYANGQGVRKDHTKAFEWFQKAAVGGNAMAQNDLGVMYASGQGVTIDVARAIEWYQKAAAQGYPEAQRNLGMMYGTGQGVPQDDKKAFEWFQKAAAQGNAMAQNDLGVIYASGLGVPKDDKKAFEWFQRAAAQGDTVAKDWIRNYMAATQAKPSSK